MGASQVINIINLLRSHPEGLTIRELARLCSASCREIAHYLRLISEHAREPVPVYCDKDGPDAESAWPDPEDGPLPEYEPDTRWFIASHDYVVPSLVLTPGEATALLEALDGMNGNEKLAAIHGKLKSHIYGGKEGYDRARQRAARRVVKGVRSLYDDLQTKDDVAYLEDCALRRAELEIDYEPMAGEPGPRKVWPLGVIYNWLQAAWYLVCWRPDEMDYRTYRVDRIRSVKEPGGTFTPPEGFSLEEYTRYAWGIERSEEKPVRVRIRFYDDFNVISLVKRDIAHREKTAKFEKQPDGSYILEDWVSGLNELRVWVRSFGPSAEVLEPEELKEGVIKSTIMLLERYGIRVE